MNIYCIKKHRVKMFVVGTILSVGSSMGITALILIISGIPIQKINMIIAVIAPLIITPVIIHVFLKMIYKIHALEQQMRELATKDSMTGLYSRKFFFDSASGLLYLALRNKQPLSVLYIDIDFFKKINDEFGHPCGDMVLSQFGSILLQNVRKSDLAGRIGGEEFCMVLPDTDASGAQIVAEKLRSLAASTIVTYETSSVQFTISIGIATLSQAYHSSPDKIFSVADKALYSAKQQGRNQVKVSIG
jgi:diguanylate cyclase (GGDEF)-like protein